jgi:hypothetical protein
MGSEGVPEQVEWVGGLVELAFAFAREDADQELQGWLETIPGR